MTRIYRYVLAHDRGMAPNPRGGLITLTTCKPEIRKTAREGDWVMGNFPAPNNEVIAWVARVERCLPIDRYAKEYPSRHDALHELGPDGELRRIPGKHEWYHHDEDQQRKDKAGKVLVFDRSQSWYFGGNGRALPHELHHLAAHGQGHRVTRRETGDLERLIDWLGPPGIHGTPRGGWDGPSSKGCGPPKPNPRKKQTRC